MLKVRRVLDDAGRFAPKLSEARIGIASRCAYKTGGVSTERKTSRLLPSAVRRWGMLPST